MEYSSEHFGHTVANITIHTSSTAKRQEGGGEGRETEVCSLKKNNQKTARENFAFKESWKNTEIPSNSVKPFALKAAIYFKRDYKKQ